MPVMETSDESDELTEYKQLFDMIDGDGTGQVTLQDISSALQNMGREMTVEDIQLLLLRSLGKQSQLCGNSWLDFQQFVTVISVILTNSIAEDEMFLVFRQFDRDGDGFISPNELRNLLERLGDNVTDQDVDDMMMEADKDGDGKVSYEEFIQVMTGSGEGSSMQESLIRNESVTNTKLDESYKNQMTSSETNLMMTTDKDFELTQTESTTCRRNMKHRKSCVPTISLRKSSLSVPRSLFSSMNITSRKSCPDFDPISARSNSYYGNSKNKINFGKRLRKSVGAIILKIKGRDSIPQ